MNLMPKSPAEYHGTRKSGWLRPAVLGANEGILATASLVGGVGHDVCALEATETDAVTAAFRYKPDLMIVDVRLRDGGGVSAVEKILRDRFVPHIFVSGDGLSPAKLNARAVVLEKLYDQADLIKAIEAALGSSAMV
ncbi:MAG: histidine kinase [Rhodospirillales bacterium]|nr:histidine kinase [Rhodospirillales bacterium]